MKSKYLGILILVLALFLVGCSKEIAPLKTNPFIGGTTGLTMEFTSGAPPVEVYDGGVFPFQGLIKIQNIGETDVAIGDVLITISGISAPDFGTTTADLEQTNTEEILGTKKNAEGGQTEGMITHLTFPENGEFNYMEELSGNTNFPFLATMCYQYSNKAIAMLCIKEDPLSTSNSVCEVTGLKNAFTSGGPIQIVNLVESPRGSDKIAFSFDVAHKGTGKVYGQGSEMCESSVTNKDKVHVSVDTGMEGLECTGLEGAEGDINLYEGKRTVTCTQVVGSGNFEKPVEIETSYHYEQETMTHVLVKHSPT